MKKLSLFIPLLLLSSCGSRFQVSGKHSAKEWVMMAVEEEYYQLDDDKRNLLTHTAIIQTPSFEFVEEAEAETYGDYLYIKDDDCYMAFFRHYLVVENYNYIEEYVYMSAIAWRYNKRLFDINLDPNKMVFNYSQIIDLDTEDVEWQ